MEDKGDPAPNSKQPKCQGKAGWVKKAHGRVLLSYKDRYVSVEKTEVLVYENEEQKNCLERVDLENYDKCHELKSAFKKKNRLVVIRSPKSGNKVHDLKFQAQSSEERDAWIKALSDAINRAKNKIFDEVKVDETSNLEHVTRTRPKGNKGRRPPTRIHMKEVADVSSDGILRLDLDLEDAMMPNGTSTTVDGTARQKQTTPSPSSSSSDTAEDKPLSTIKEAEDEEPPQKTIIKPPVPPSKQTATIEEGTEEEDIPEKKILKPPMPPSKELSAKEPKADKTPETSPDSKKKVPPMPPNKPLLSIITPAETSPSKTTVHPPTPPSKEKKPTVSAEPTQETTENTDEEDSEKTEDKQKNITNAKSPSPKLSPKEEDLPKSDVPTTISPQSEVEEPKSDVPVVVVSLKDPESVNSSPLRDHLLGEDKVKKAEEKSVDSGQHSDEDSEVSGSEDALATGVLRGSNNGLDAIDKGSNVVEISVNLKPEISATKGYTSWISQPPKPLKPKTKMRSASSGDLLSDSCEFRDGAKRSSSSSGGADVTKLETEVALEMENTSELLSRASRAQTVPKDGGKNPHDLLSEALEKLKRADHVLREVKKLKLAKDMSHRKSL